MQFSILATLALVSTFAAATPTLPVKRDCSIGKCLAALAPLGVSCAAAGVEEGINIIADAGCIVSALNDVENTPAACNGCV